MMDAECPVCQGWGSRPRANPDAVWIRCGFCKGRGWVNPGKRSEYLAQQQEQAARDAEALRKAKEAMR
jgi:hypothetical protein